jgi:hypothetical protein
VRFEEYAFLLDPETGLGCYRVPVAPETDDVTRDLREWHAERSVELGYAGFSWDLDEPFHRRSDYLVIADAQGEVVMSCRGTRRRPGEPLPFETAQRDGAPPYALDPDLPAVSFNTFTCRSGFSERILPLQIAGLGRYAKLQGARRAYCLDDVRTGRLQRAFAAYGWHPTPAFPDPVHFPTYGRLESSRFEPARWRILEWTGETINRHERLARARFVAVGN